MIFDLCLMFTVHYVADYWFQTEKQALGKSGRDSESTWLLTKHVLTYSLPFLVLFGFKFAVVTFVLHWITDRMSAPLAAYFYKAGRLRRFHQVLGFDQLIHTFSLLFAYHHFVL